MPTPNRKYTEVPANVAPDVPHYVNLALRDIDADFAKVEKAASTASDDAAEVKRRANAGEFRGLPGVNAVPTDKAVATYIGSPPTETNTAVRGLAAAVAAPLITAGLAPLVSAGDPLTYLNRLKHFITLPARPAGNLWPQGFSMNAAEKRLYVAYSGSLDGGVSNTLRICMYDYAGTMLQSRDIATEAGTSTEGLPWFRNANGDLCFIVRPAAAGRGYAVYNFSKSNLGPVIPLPGGNYKSAQEGDSFYTVDSNDSTNGFSRIFVYAWESIKTQAPVLLETIILETHNRMPKVQSFTVNGGIPVFNHGPGKSNFYLSAYTPGGGIAAGYELDKAGFADAVNAGAPGAITNPESYRHESEGAWTHEGKTYTGHVVDNNTTDYKFVIMAHNCIDGAQVQTKPMRMVHDTDWQPVTVKAPFTPWNEATAPRIRRSGNAVHFDGAVKGLVGFPGTNVVVANVADFAPSRQLELPIQESSDQGYASWKIRPNGDLILSETTAPNYSAATWFPFTFTWLQG